VAGLLERYEAIAKETEAFVAGLEDLDLPVPLPTAPWAPERQWWSARKVLLHIIRETAHHSGHADIIRESLDGANTTRQQGADAGMTFE
ncbi:MAG: DinB family protein, partial [Rhodococcus sp. (in: high G+C Gram-positive bacteria)]|nr:DinB family protein [Rhodococcus sp. (in: high G+C Gram-positive bacteria)]